MKLAVLLVGLFALPAQAQLYRWVDPESGSVKFSNTPPPWFRDSEGQRGAPAVEVIQPRGPAAAPPAAKPAAVKPAVPVTAKPAAPAIAKPAADDD